MKHKKKLLFVIYEHYSREYIPKHLKENKKENISNDHGGKNRERKRKRQHKNIGTRYEKIKIILVSYDFAC